MKKIVVAGVAVAVLAIAGISFAGPGMKGGCCQDAVKPGDGMNADKMKEFRKESLPLRQQISEKRFQIEKEQFAEKPDEKKISDLKKEMEDLHLKKETLRGKYGFSSERRCGKMQGKGIHDKGIHGKRMNHPTKLQGCPDCPGCAGPAGM